MPGKRAAIVGPEHGPVGIAPEIGVPRVRRRRPGAQNVARQPGGSGREGNVCQPQVMVRRPFHLGGNRKEVDAEIDLAVLAHGLLRGRRLGPARGSSPCRDRRTRAAPGRSSSARRRARNRPRASRTKSTGCSSGRARRRGRRTSRPPWCKSAWPLRPARRFPGRAGPPWPAALPAGATSRWTFTKPSNSTCVRAASRRPAASASPVKSASASTRRPSFGSPGRISISLPSLTATSRIGAASCDTPPLITRRAMPRPSSESVRFHTPTSLPLHLHGVQGGITWSETPTLLFIHSAA